MLTKHKYEKKGLAKNIALMPQDSASQKILHERATLLAKPKFVDNNQHLSKFVRFRLSHDELYGIPYQYIKEIVRDTTLTKIPHTVGFIAGVINLRGKLIAVLDLWQFFQSQPLIHDETAHIIVVESNQLTLGILAATIEGGESFDPLTLELSSSLSSIIKPEYIMGLHQGITAIIHLENLIADIKQRCNKFKE